MKNIVVILLFIFFFQPATSLAKTKKQNPKVAEKLPESKLETVAKIYSFAPLSITEKPVPLSKFSGKVLLIVNTASKCGYTPQYHDLEILYDQYKKQGLEILAFPSNDFANQEPGTNSEIQKFCKLNYGVTFPLFARDHVSGPEKSPLFKYLTEENGDNNGEIQWNFEKFIVGKDGVPRYRFGSYVNPLSKRITSVLEKLLAN
jgi:glutathione peroxidase